MQRVRLRAKSGLRGGAGDGARAWPKNIHVARLIVDCGGDTEWVRQRRLEALGPMRSTIPIC